MSLDDLMSVGGITELERLLAQRRDEMQAARSSDEPASTDEQLLVAALSYVQPRRQAEDARKREKRASGDRKSFTQWLLLVMVVCLVALFAAFFVVGPLAALKIFAVVAGVLLAIGAAISLVAHPNNADLDAIGKLVTYTGALAAAMAAGLFAWLGI